MVQLFDNDTGAPLGTISEEAFQFMVDHLEEESLRDQDYYINEDTLVVFENEDAPDSLMEVLRNALDDRQEMEIRWEHV